LIGNERVHGLRQSIHVATTNQESVLSRPYQLGHTACPISNVGNIVNPGFQEYETERIGTAGQGKNIETGKEISLFFFVQDAEASDGGAGAEALPETTEIRHFRTCQDQLETLASPPQHIGRPQQIDASLLLTLICQVPDDYFVIGDSPLLARALPVPTRAFILLYAHPEPYKLVFRDSPVFQSGVLQVCLHENAIGLVKQSQQGR
jgi:hypothetical protein